MGAPALLLMALIRAYQRFIRPLLPSTCRFYPSCSDYAAVAVKRHGAARGTILTAARIARCHPFHPGGIDPVPARFTLRSQPSCTHEEATP